MLSKTHKFIVSLWKKIWGTCFFGHSLSINFMICVQEIELGFFLFICLHYCFNHKNSTLFESMTSYILLQKGERWEEGRGKKKEEGRGKRGKRPDEKGREHERNPTIVLGSWCRSYDLIPQAHFQCNDHLQLYWGGVEKIDESSKCIDRHKTCLKEKIQGRKRWFEFWKHATFSVSKSDF